MRKFTAWHMKRAAVSMTTPNRTMDQKRARKLANTADTSTLKLANTLCESWGSGEARDEGSDGGDREEGYQKRAGQECADDASLDDSLDGSIRRRKYRRSGTRPAGRACDSRLHTVAQINTKNGDVVSKLERSTNAWPRSEVLVVPGGPTGEVWSQIANTACRWMGSARVPPE